MAKKVRHVKTLGMEEAQTGRARMHLQDFTTRICRSMQEFADCVKDDGGHPEHLWT